MIGMSGRHVEVFFPAGLAKVNSHFYLYNRLRNRGHYFSKDNLPEKQFLFFKPFLRITVSFL